MKRSLTMAITFYKDETTIKELVLDAIQVAKDFTDDYEILIANDASPKGVDVINELEKEHEKVRIIHHEKNQGFGGAMWTLYTKAEKDLVFTLPGDAQFDPKEFRKMYPWLEGNDLIVGLRKNRGDTFPRRLQSAIYNALVSLMAGKRFYDVNSIKLAKRKVLHDFTIETKSAFIDAELCIKASKRKFKVMEVPILHKERSIGVGCGSDPKVIKATIADFFKMWKQIRNFK